MTFQFEFVKIEETGEWDASREGFVDKIYIRAIRNYSVEEVDPSGEMGMITFCFFTNVKSKGNEKIDIKIDNYTYDMNKILNSIRD